LNDGIHLFINRVSSEKIPKLIKSAEFINEKEVKHDRFIKFRFYDSYISIGKECYQVTLNIGMNKNDEYVLYALNPYI
jgi:hypothetical protein